MSDDLLLLYLLTRLDNIIGTAVSVLVVSCGITFFFGIVGWDDGNSEALEIAQKSGIAIAITAAILVLVPTKQDAMFILASAGIIEAAQSDTTKRIAGKSVEVFEKYLDTMLKEEKK